MKRIHNLKRTIALFLAMLMAATSTAFADWDSFQGNNDNNGITDIAVTSRNPSSTTVNLPNDDATTGLDVEPLVYGSRIYAFHNGGNNGATVTAVDATDGSQLWTTVVGPNAKNVSQIATPVITEDGKTMYGVYTYGHNAKTTGAFSDTIATGGSATETFTMVLPCTYANLQISTGLSNSTWTAGDYEHVLSATATIKDSSGKPVTTTPLSGSSYEDQGFSLYYGDYSGDPIPAGTYTVEMTVTNTTTQSVTWTGEGTQALVNYWEMFQVTGIDGSDPKVEMLTNEPSGDPAQPSNNGYGQPASPLTLANGNVYFGIYDGDVAYFQYNTESKGLNKFVPGNNNSFYNAGAVVVDDKVIFGSENGTLYMLSTDSFTTIGDPLELAGATKIRSSICYDSEFKTIYLTSQNGLLWRVELSDSGFASEPKSTSIVQGDIANSVSTPVVSKSGLIYVSVYGYNKDFVGEGYIVATSRNSFTENNKIYVGDTVQCSPVVYWDKSNNTDYIYFTTNTENGSGYCYQCKYTVSSEGTGKIWSVTPDSGGNGYAVQGFAMGLYKEEDEEGELLEVPFEVFGNDSNQIIIVK